MIVTKYKRYVLLVLFCRLTLLYATAQTTRISFMAPEVYPEGITYDPQKELFYVSSVTTGTIGSVDKQGNYKPFYEDKSLKSTYGLKVDTKQNRLWACVSDGNYSKLSDSTTFKKMGRLISIDLTSGKKVTDLNLAESYKGKHFINDITLDGKGNLYVTDSYSPVIYKIDTTGKVSVLAESQYFQSIDVGLNGIVYHPQGYLLVNNNSQGALYKVDLQNPTKIKRVKINHFFPGSDGMLLDGTRLLLIQNKSVDKVYQLSSSDQWQTAQLEASTEAEDRFQQPTTATKANGKVYVLNSKLNELADPVKRPSKEFSIQLVEFRPVK